MHAIRRSRLPLFIALLLATCLDPAAAAPPEAGDAEAAEARFSPVAELTGHCWRGEVASGVADVHCWEWTIQRGFVRDRHRIEGPGDPYSGETLYGWDEEASELRYWYFNSLGGVSEGSVEKTPEGWLFVETYRDARGSLELRTRLLRPDERSYTFVTERREGSTWRLEREVRFERMDDPPPAPHPAPPPG